MSRSIVESRSQFPGFARNCAALLGVSAVIGNFAAPSEANYNPDMTRFPKALGKQTLAMVSVDFAGQAKLPFGNEVVHDQVFEAEGSVADYYKKASFGKFTLNGEVFGPITLSPKVIGSDCNVWGLPGLGRTVNKLVRQQTGQDLGGFDHYGYTLPRSTATRNCDWGGWSFGNGFVDLETRGKYGLKPNKFYEGAVVHELAHNFGLGHANAISCHSKTGKAVGFTIKRFSVGDCREIVYGDPVDPMGLGELTTETPPDMSAINKARLGWLKPNNIQTLTRNGIVTIAPLEVETNKPQLVRIANRFTVNDRPHYFYLDFRQPTALDKDIPPDSPFVNGVAIRESGPINDPSAKPLANFTYFIDTTPKTPGANDGTLAVGKTFKDSSTGISIKTLSAGPEGAKILVGGLRSAPK